MRITTYLLLLAVLYSCQPLESHVAEFRGPDRTGIFTESGLMKSWPDSGPEMILLIEGIGSGYGSPVIADNHLYVTGTKDSISVLFCFDLQGVKLWEIELGKEWIENYPGSRSSPTVVDEFIYAGTGFGTLSCINRKNHSLIWQVDAISEYNGELPLFGHSESPLIHEDKVFWAVGGKKNNIIALNRYTGDLIWTSKGMKERSGYNHPRVIQTPAGRKILVIFSAYHLMGLDADTGELLWSHEQVNYPPSMRNPGYGDTHANTVIYDNGSIYYAAGDGNCGVKLDLSDDGTEITELWINKEFDSYMGGIIKVNGYLYGGGTAKPGLYAIDATKGIISDSLMIGSGVLICADSMLYYYNHGGQVHLIDFDEGKLSDISTFRMTRGSQQHFSHPIIHNAVLYIRHGEVIAGYDIRLK